MAIILLIYTRDILGTPKNGRYATVDDLAGLGDSRYLADAFLCNLYSYFDESADIWG